MPPRKGSTFTQGWYAIQHTSTGEWLCTLRSMTSWGKPCTAFQFSVSKSDAIWYRRKGAAEFYLRQLLAQKHSKRSPHYHIVKEESAGPQALKKRAKKEATNADPNRNPKDQA